MPTISRFFGIDITMNNADHPAPHFHARYGGQRAQIDIASGRVIAGSLSPQALSLVRKWAKLHRAELEANWRLMEQTKPMNKIEPLS